MLGGKISNFRRGVQLIRTRSSNNLQPLYDKGTAQMKCFILVLLACLGLISCSSLGPDQKNTPRSMILYELGGVTTSSTAVMIGDAYTFLEKNALDWGKVQKIERTKGKVIYIVFPTMNQAGRPNRLIWVSPTVVKMACAD